MSEINAETMSKLYDKDFALWIQQTVRSLQIRDFQHLDLINLIEEVEGLGKSDKRGICNFLRRLCEHLLKIQYWESEREVWSFRFRMRHFLGIYNRSIA